MSIILYNISSLIHNSGSGSENENINENVFINENENDYKIGVLPIILIVWGSIIVGTIVLAYCSLGLIVLYDYIKELIQKCKCNCNCNCKFKKKKNKNNSDYTNSNRL